jgi:hypothetical protein
MLATLLALFILGSWGFWILLAIASVIIIACINGDSGPKATVTFLIAAGLIALSNHFGWRDFLANWQAFAICAGLYVTLGTGWGLIKWFSFVHKIRRKFDDALPKILKPYSVTSLAELSKDDKYKAMKDMAILVYGYYGNASDFPPQFSKNKSNVLFWMTFWPWSLFWTLLDDPIRRLFETIYRSLGKIGQRISDAAFADIAQDLK